MNTVNPEKKVYALPELALLQVCGEKAAHFLQGQITCDVCAIPEKQAQLSARLNRQGRVVANFYVVKQSSSEFWLLLHTSLAQTVMTDLNRYAQLSRVNINQLTQWDCFGIENSTQIECGELSQSICFPSVTAKTRHYCLLPNTAASIMVTESQNDVWFCQEIQSGFAFITEDTTEKFLPQELNYSALKALSFEKGCYLGQEVVTRVEHRGHLKRHLHYRRCRKNIVLKSGVTLWRDDNSRAIAEIVAASVDMTQTGHYLLLIQDDAQSTRHFRTESGVLLEVEEGENSQ